MILAAAAAAAAAGSFFELSGVPDPCASGLRLLRVSDFLLDGDRDRLSNLEDRLGSGSVLSKRERRRGSSAIFAAGRLSIECMKRAALRRMIWICE